MESTTNPFLIRCQELLGGHDNNMNNDNNNNVELSSSLSSICLGIINNNEFSIQLENSIRIALDPYINNNQQKNQVTTNNTIKMMNQFSKRYCKPSIIVPGDIIYRYNEEHINSNNTEENRRKQNLTEFCANIKQYINDSLIECIDKIDIDINKNNDHNNNNNNNNEYPSCVNDEEQGYLCVHVIIVPKQDIVNQRPSYVIQQQQERDRKKRSHHHHILDVASHGGDPKTTLESKINNEHNICIWTINQALDTLISSYEKEEQQQSDCKKQKTIDDDNDVELNNNNEAKLVLKHNATIHNHNNNTILYDIHVTVWRRPFYIRGLYTKTRRDVSQTPFFVDDDDNNFNDSNTNNNDNNNTNNNNNNKGRKKLGFTSVEEEITKVLIPYCNGISKLNQNPYDPRNNRKNYNNNNNNNDDNHNNLNILYGMAKFHASGREDMDVRMLLPTNEQYYYHHHNDDDKQKQQQHNNNINIKITGRPFVYEVIDALSIPTMNTLSDIVHDINNNDPSSSHDDDDHMNIPNLITTSSSSTNTSTTIPPTVNNINSYGNNTLTGVGISNDLCYVSSKSFTNLQSETENKIKYYHCYCWCEKILPIDINDTILKSNIFPLQIHQQTPIRVLHRRSNIIRIRHILSCTIQRDNDHYFHLYISTEAGTYVKEFVHSDLGRTKPSISSIFNCKTDILQLDCEGIQC